MTQSKLLGLLYDTSSQQSSEMTNQINSGDRTNSNAYSPSEQNEDLMYNEARPYINGENGGMLVNQNMKYDQQANIDYGA